MRSVLRIAETVALAWWVFAVSVTFLVKVHLPHAARNSSSSGCYVTSDWFEYVDCGSPLAAAILGNVLTLAMLWTKDIQVLIDLAMVPPFLPLMLFWIGSVLLALIALTRRLRKALWEA